MWRWQRQESTRRQLFVAYQAEALARAKRLPDLGEWLDELTTPSDKPAPTPEELAEQDARRARAWNSMFAAIGQAQEQTP